MKKLLLFFLFVSSVIYAQPPIAQVSYYFYSCDNVGDSFAVFDVTAYDEMILNGLNPNEYTISYHTSLEGAQTKSEVALNPTSFVSSTFTSIYIRVEQNSIPSNYAVNSYSFVINQQPTIGQPLGLIIYENPSDGLATFDLTSNQATFLNSNSLSNVTVDYYLTRENAENQVDVIANPQTFTGADLQNIFVRVHYNTTGCYVIKSFKLYVKTEDYIVNFPDAILKAKLLSSSTTSNIASIVNPNSTSTPNVYSKIDLNNDGEIQFSEVQSIIYLRLNNSGITNLTGLEAFVNLRYFTCSNNPISTIDLSSFPHLITAVAENTSTTTLNVNNCFNLEDLNCSYGQLTNVDLTTCLNLRYLSLAHQQLSSLNLNENNRIKYANVTFNALTTFTLQDNNIRTLEIGFNNLTALNLINLPFLYRIKAQNNALTNVDLSSVAFQREPNNLSPSNVLDIGLNNNSNLLQINLKNNYKNTNSSFFSGSLANSPQIICIDANDIYSYFDTTSGSVSNTFCSYTPGNFNTLTGVVKFDSNADGCNAEDQSVNFLSFNMIVNGIDTNEKVFSNTTGNYSTTFDELGTYTLLPNLEIPNYFSVAPNPAVITITQIDNTTTIQNFCITPNGIHPDLEVVLVPIVPARPGFDAVYKIVYKNKGNQTVNGIVFFDFNYAYMDFVSAVPAANNGSFGYYGFNFTNLAPFETRSILVTLNINAPTETNGVNIGDVLELSASVILNSGSTSETETDDNLFTLNQIVVGSFDPNDITCLQGNALPLNAIGKYLHYNIRFENTGTAPAENIVVKNQIDLSQYDIQSLQVLESSHPVVVKVTGNIAEFIFQGIDLDTGGHGNILLKLKSNATLPADLVINSANIFFDYNFPIVTNEEQTIFADLSKNDFNRDISIQVYPNPAESEVFIKAEHTINSIQLFDAQGRILQTKMSNKNSESVDLSSYSSGIYFITVATSFGQQTQKVIKK
ncbi:T9SS type A sorting domain-containing protein [Flavobacterium antarcticum]|uniref:DUF7619 domain-containing protein n=1 Tax=Flavobacterium antarcticum TaxID=271155 RepID=UPI0003B5A57B|nr:T9SS type A sorting domain-containing protein [Flavobacterium antarcticum]